MSRCIACGLRTVFFQRMCKQCFLENHPIILDTKPLSVVVCGECGLLFAGKQWSTFFLDEIENPEVKQWFSSLILKLWRFQYKPTSLVVKEVETVIDEESRDPIAATGYVEIQASPDAFVPLLGSTEELYIKLEWGECTECRERASGRYNAKIQVRTHQRISPEHLSQWNEEITMLSQNYPLRDGKNPLFRINVLKTGIDALFQTRSPALAVAREFARNRGGILSTTTEFAGFDKSRSREYPRRHVVLVDLPPYEADEIIIYNGDPVQILGFRDFKVDYWDFKQSRHQSSPVKQFREATIQTVDQEFTRFQLVNFEHDNEMAQIMDTSTFETRFVEIRFLPRLSEGETFLGIWLSDILVVKRQEKDK
ncbi:MAG: NMD3-related protein [Candidatus Heimdallarchaeota archaeon]